MAPRDIKELEIETTRDLLRAEDNGLDAFLTDENFAHGYNASDDKTYVAVADYSIDSLDVVAYLARRFGAVTIVGDDDTEATLTQSGLSLTIDKRVCVQAGVEPCDAVTMEQIADFGGGDMVKAVYDTDDSGVVDDSELVNGVTVETAVPANASFSDGITITFSNTTELQALIDSGETELYAERGAIITGSIELYKEKEYRIYSLAGQATDLTLNGCTFTHTPTVDRPAALEFHGSVVLQNTVTIQDFGGNPTRFFSQVIASGANCELDPGYAYINIINAASADLNLLNLPTSVQEVRGTVTGSSANINRWLDALDVNMQTEIDSIDGVLTTHVADLANPHQTDSLILPISDPAAETISGTATTQQGANIESKSAIESNTESILNLTGASMKIAELGGTFATTEVMFDFDTVTPSDNTDLLDANDTTNIVTLKKPLRYQFQTYISVNTTGAGDKTLTIRVYNNAGDTLLSERDIAIDGGINNNQSFTLDPAFVDSPIEDLEIYFTAQCTDTQVDLIELNTTIVTGGGGGGGIWDIQDGEIKNVGSRPVSVSVITSGIGDLTVTGTGTAYDATYTDTSNPDGFGNPTLSDGVNTVIKDDTNAFWCLAAGVITANPALAATQYANFTGSIEGVYTVVLGAGTDGSATIANGGGGSHAISANADIVAPVIEITGKAARRYNFTDSYIVDTIIEPETGAAYVVVTNGIARMAIPVGGVGNATQMYRSMFVGGVSGTPVPNDDIDVANTLFDDTFIPCDTDTTGADFGVGGSAQIIKKLLIGLLEASGDRITLDPSGSSYFSKGILSGLDAAGILALGGTAFQTADSVIEIVNFDIAAGTNVTITSQASHTNGASVSIGRGFTTVAVVATGTIATVPVGYRPSELIYDTIVNLDDGVIHPCFISTDGTIKLSAGSIPSGGNFRFSIPYPRA